MYITTRDPSPPISASAPGTTHASSRHWRATARFPLPAQRKVHCDPSTHREGHVRRRAAAITCSTCARETRNSRAIAAGPQAGFMGSADQPLLARRDRDGLAFLCRRRPRRAARCLLVLPPALRLIALRRRPAASTGLGRNRLLQPFQLGVVEIAQRSIQIGR